MKRIILISTMTAAIAILGAVNTSSAETTVPIEDLAMVSESSIATTPLADGLQPEAVPRFQFPRLQYPRFQFPRFQFPRFQHPRFQFPRFQFPRFQFPRFQHPRFQFPRFQFPHHGI